MIFVAFHHSCIVMYETSMIFVAGIDSKSTEVSNIWMYYETWGNWTNWFSLDITKFMTRGTYRFFWFST